MTRNGLAPLLLVSALASTSCGVYSAPPKENLSTADLVDYRNGLRLIREGRIDEAISLLQRARVSYPAEPAVPNALGLALLYRKDFEPAIRAFTDALKIKKDFHEARVYRGVALMEVGRLDTAEEDFRAVIDEAPAGAERVSARLNLGLVSAKRKLFTDAERDFSLVIADDPQSTRAFRERALVRMERESFRDALDDLLRVLKDEPKDPVANYNAALCLLAIGRRDLAVRYMQRVASVAPESTEGRKARRFVEGEGAASATPERLESP